MILLKEALEAVTDFKIRLEIEYLDCDIETWTLSPMEAIERFGEHPVIDTWKEWTTDETIGDEIAFYHVLVFLSDTDEEKERIFNDYMNGNF